MKGRDLEAEAWGAIGNVRQHHLDRLVDLGCAMPALSTLSSSRPILGVAKVATSQAGLFQPDERGSGAFVMPVTDWDDFGPTVFDLIAWSPSDPARWWWRVGSASMLGEDMLAEDCPIPVVPDPVQWLAVGGQAVCILDWSARSRAWRLLRDGPGLTFIDDTLRKRVRNSLIESAPLPTMELVHAAA